MRDRTSAKAKRDSQFRESLAPSFPLVTGADPMPLRSPIVPTVLWFATVVVAGIVLGLAIRPHADRSSLIGAPGAAAVVTDPPTALVRAARSLAQPVSVSANLAVFALASATTPTTLAVAPPVHTGTALQATVGATGLFIAGDINALQPGFSAYGSQGSVGISAVR